MQVLGTSRAFQARDRVDWEVTPHGGVEKGEPPEALGETTGSKCLIRWAGQDDNDVHLVFSGDKRFECAQCQKRFMRSDHLTKHYKTHLVTKNL